MWRKLFVLWPMVCVFRNTSDTPIQLSDEVLIPPRGVVWGVGYRGMWKRLGHHVMSVQYPPGLYGEYRYVFPALNMFTYRCGYLVEQCLQKLQSRTLATIAACFPQCMQTIIPHCFRKCRQGGHNDAANRHAVLSSTDTAEIHQVPDSFCVSIKANADDHPATANQPTTSET